MSRHPISAHNGGMGSSDVQSTFGGIVPGLDERSILS